MFDHALFNDSDNLYPRLKGKTAIVRSSEEPWFLLAQFDDITLAEAYGWWRFPAHCFTVEPKGTNP
jgi:hypothetical protein